MSTAAASSPERRYRRRPHRIHPRPPDRSRQPDRPAGARSDHPGQQHRIRQRRPPLRPAQRADCSSQDEILRTSAASPAPSSSSPSPTIPSPSTWSRMSRSSTRPSASPPASTSSSIPTTPPSASLSTSPMSASSDALRIVGTIAGTFYKPVTANTIFVAQNTRTKRTDLDEVGRPDLLPHQRQPAGRRQRDPQTAIRNLLDPSIKINLVPSQNAIVMRATPDQLLLAQKAPQRPRSCQARGRRRRRHPRGQPRQDAQPRHHPSAVRHHHPAGQPTTTTSSTHHHDHRHHDDHHL